MRLFEVLTHISRATFERLPRSTPFHSVHFNASSKVIFQKVHSIVRSAATEIPISPRSVMSCEVHKAQQPQNFFAMRLIWTSHAKTKLHRTWYINPRDPEACRGFLFPTTVPNHAQRYDMQTGGIVDMLKKLLSKSATDKIAEKFGRSI